MSTPFTDPAQLPCRRMLVGMTGSVGIYDFLHYLAALKGTVTEDLRVIQTPDAARMLDAKMTAKVADCEVWRDAWEDKAGVTMPHVHLPMWAEAFLIVPATANTLAAAAHGHASNLLQLAALSYGRPIAFVPNMNDAMCTALSTQRNVVQLRADGHLVLSQGAGSGGGFAVGEQVSSAQSAPDPVTFKDFVLELIAASRGPAARPIPTAGEDEGHFSGPERQPSRTPAG